MKTYLPFHSIVVVAIGSVIIILGVAANLHQQHSQPYPWTIRSWEKGTITVDHAGLTYTAKCSITLTKNADGTNEEPLVDGCLQSISEVGVMIADRATPLEIIGVSIWQDPGELVVQKWTKTQRICTPRGCSKTDDGSAWVQNRYTITSVQKTGGRQQ
jgi:hypothetical protein